MIQLVKCREYRRVSTVYIPMYHEVVIRRTYGRHEVCVRGHSEASQNTLDISGGDILS